MAFDLFGVVQVGGKFVRNPDCRVYDDSPTPRYSGSSTTHFQRQLVSREIGGYKLLTDERGKPISVEGGLVYEILAPYGTACSYVCVIDHY